MDKGRRAGGGEGGARPDAKGKGFRADKVYYIHLCRFPLFLYILSDFFFIELTRMRMTFCLYSSVVKYGFPTSRS